MLGAHTGECFPVNVFACWSLGLVLGLDFFCIYRMFDCLVVLGSGPLCLPVSLPAVSGSRRALRSTPAGCTPTGVAFAVEPSQLGVGTSLHFSGIQRGAEWTGGRVSRQKAGCWCPPAQLPLVGKRGVSRERTFPRPHSKSGQSWEENPRNPQTWLFPPQSSAD